MSLRINILINSTYLSQKTMLIYPKKQLHCPVSNSDPHRKVSQLFDLFSVFSLKQLRFYS